MSLKQYHGSCICGAIKFEVGLDLSTDSGRCNCTNCWKIRFWYMRAKPANFKLLTSPARIADTRSESSSSSYSCIDQSRSTSQGTAGRFASGICELSQPTSSE